VPKIKPNKAIEELSLTGAARQDGAVGPPWVTCRRATYPLGTVGLCQEVDAEGGQPELTRTPVARRGLFLVCRARDIFQLTDRVLSHPFRNIAEV
jgi:hypothetical protein